MASLKQIHSSLSIVADGSVVADGLSGCVGEGDALIASRPGLTVSIRTADCFPILLADPVHRVVAAVHAGWRGTAAEIVTVTLRRMSEEFGTRAEDVAAAIGPGIGVCCYRVGEEVARRFGKDSAGNLDLAQENQRQLIRAGERAGRMISFVGVKKQ
jgi:polyphenol oxidase